MSADAKAEQLRLQREAEERQRQEEERRRQAEAARPRCSDYTYYGSNARPEPAGGDNYQCPKGYQCHWNHLLLECRAYVDNVGIRPNLTATTVVYQEDTWLCRMDFCGNHDPSPA